LKKKTQHRILIVDDEEDLRTLLGMVLEGAGYRISTASDGLEALAMLKKQDFDAALLDIQMPNMDGIQVLKYITEHHPATKSIVLTGYADLRHATEAKRNGAADFIGKPYRFEEIVGSLERSLA
jgi:DNA-binding NtrC family response regulator